MLMTDLCEEVLYRAIKTDNLDTLKALLAQGELSDIHFFQYCGDTPLGLAVAEGKEQLVPLLFPSTDKCFALHAAVKLKQEGVVRYLREHCSYQDKFLHFLGLK